MRALIELVVPGTACEILRMWAGGWDFSRSRKFVPDPEIVLALAWGLWFRAFRVLALRALKARDRSEVGALCGTPCGTRGHIRQWVRACVRAAAAGIGACAGKENILPSLQFLL